MGRTESKLLPLVLTGVEEQAPSRQQPWRPWRLSTQQWLLLLCVLQSLAFVYYSAYWEQLDPEDILTSLQILDDSVFMDTAGGIPVSSKEHLQFIGKSKKEINKNDVSTKKKIGVDIRGEVLSHGNPAFVLDTPGCRIPNFPAVNHVNLEFIKNQAPEFKCEELWSPMSGSRKQRGPPLVESNMTALRVIESALPHYNLSSTAQLSCCYRPFHRLQDDPNNYTSDSDDKVKFINECVPFMNEIIVNSDTHEFVRVECSHVIIPPTSEPSYSSSSSEQESRESTTNLVTSESIGTPQMEEIYRDFHAFVPVKRKVEERCMTSPHNSDEVSVLILGIDATSRLNMLRQMPLTYSILTQTPLSAISLMGYNKVGDNTFPNVVPFLTGLAEEELKEGCPWPSRKHKLDPCPFIWKDFAKRGYRTAYAEDCATMTTFNYWKTGFVEQPTDYYPRPFMFVSKHI